MSAPPLAGSEFDKNQIPPGGLPPPPKYGSIDGHTNYGYGQPSYQGYPNSQPYGANATQPTSTYIVSFSPNPKFYPNRENPGEGSPFTSWSL